MRLVASCMYDSMSGSWYLLLLGHQFRYNDMNRETFFVLHVWDDYVKMDS